MFDNWISNTGNGNAGRLLCGVPARLNGRFAAMMCALAAAALAFLVRVARRRTGGWDRAVA